MKDIIYGFKLALGFMLAQIVAGTVAFGIGLGILYGLGLSLTQAANNAATQTQQEGK